MSKLNLKLLKCLLLLALISGLGACKVAPPPPLPPPLDIAASVQGESLVYIFRPRIDNVGEDDHPTLLVDGQKIARLGLSNYTLVSLKPGTHQFQIAAGSNEDDDWNIKQEVGTGEGQAYFLAIWHTDQSKNNYTHYYYEGTGHVVNTANFLITLGQAIAQGHQGTLASVHFEQVERDMGAEALGGLKLVPAEADHLVPPVANEASK